MNINTNNRSAGNFEKMIIKDIVLQNFKAAEVMEKYGIDFCCKGKRPLDEAIAEKNINSERFLKELEKTFQKNSGEDERFETWDLHFLAQYIVNNHHAYIKEKVPVITAHLEKINNVHGAKHTFLKNVLDEFESLANELLNHMAKEERILFPIIKYLVDSKRFNEKPHTEGYGAIKNPIMKMESEHDTAGNAAENIRTLTNNYKLPDDACTTFRVTYQELEEFEKDLHKHVHLENNILFPKSILLEEELLTRKK